MIERPWSRRALLWLVAANLVALAGLAISWWALRSAATFASQERWIVVAVGSLVVSLAGSGLWIASAMRANRQLQDSTLQTLATVPTTDELVRAGYLLTTTLRRRPRST